MLEIPGALVCVCTPCSFEDATEDFFGLHRLEVLDKPLASRDVALASIVQRNARSTACARSNAWPQEQKGSCACHTVAEVHGPSGFGSWLLSARDEWYAWNACACRLQAEAQGGSQGAMV